VRCRPTSGSGEVLKQVLLIRHGNQTPAPGIECSRTKTRVLAMPLIQLVEVLIVVGVLLWLVNRFIPMQSTIKSILNAVVVIAVVLWILNVTGLFHSFSGIRVGR
jgi:hypothetical protein